MADKSVTNFGPTTIMIYFFPYIKRLFNNIRLEINFSLQNGTFEFHINLIWMFTSPFHHKR